MCRKLICLFTVILVLGTAGNVWAELVGYWRLDEGSGTIAYDSSGNGHDGTINGDPQWVAGRNGKALDFDGTEDYIDIGLGAGDYFATLNSGLTVAAWISREGTGTYDIVFGAGRNPVGTTAGDDNNGWKFGIDSGDVIKFTTLGILDYTSSVGVPLGEWVHIAATFNEAGTEAQIYLNGNFEQAISGNGPANPATGLYAVGFGGTWALEFFDGMLDEVRVYNHVLTGPEILAAMEGGKGYPYALGPSPTDGALYSNTWATISWRAGDFAVSHDVYLGDNFSDVNEATRDSDLFQGNQTGTFLVAGFPGYPYPDGLVPGTTYYWRIDEVNETDPNSPWKGEVWSFSIPPKTAYYPNPADGAEFVELNVQLKWTAGFGAKLHYIVFGENFDEVSSATIGVPSGPTNYTPGPLKLAKTYYWRVDEFDGTETHKGEVWSFTTEGAVSGPNPADGAVDVKPTVVLSWDAGAVAASHEVYFDTDADAVKNATKASPEYKGPKALGEEIYDPGKLMLNTAYYWRIDEVNSANTDSPWAGNVWNFTTGDFLVIDDFEDYDVGVNEIWWAWKDGLGYAAHDNEPAYSGNGTGSTVGDETTASYTEETIVHGGSQSMPLAFDNNKQGYLKYSEVELKLADQRDWTEEGVVGLSLWFHGDLNNSAEPLYVAVSNSAGSPAVLVYDDPAAANIDTWTEWIIPLQAFTDQGINLTNVDRIAIGLGTKGNMTVPGGSGKIFIDDIKLYRTREATE